MFRSVKRYFSRKTLSPKSELALEYGNNLKYFLYLSKTKVRMLFPQIPPNFLDGASADIKVNLGLFSSTLKSGTQSSVGGLPGQLSSVCQYLIYSDQVGTETSDKPYIGGVLPLRYGAVTEYASDIAFFGGEVDGMKVGLIGATASLVGKVKVSSAENAPFYYTLKFLNEISEAGEETDERPAYHDFASAFDTAMKSVPGKKHSLEFVAKVLHREDNLVIATPLYVALV